MKKVVAILVCVAVLLVGDTVLDKSGIESSFGAKKACDGGEMLGCSNLGSRYAIGNGVEKDLGKAVELFKKACDGGNMRGCYNLGIMYEYGKGVEKNVKKVIDLYNKACDGGEVHGCSNLGFIYSFGKGVEKKRTKSSRVIQKSL